MATKDPKETKANEGQVAKGSSSETTKPPTYEKPRLRAYAPLQEMTFLTIIGSSGVGIITSISGGGH